MMKKITAIMMALMMVFTLTQCKPDNGNEENNQDGPKVKVSCTIPINDGGKSDFSNVMTDGSIKWSEGYERIYLAIPNESNPQIIELVSPETTVESNILTFEGEVEAELLTEGQDYEVWYLGNSKESGNSYITETKEGDIIKSISGSIANQSGDLDDLGYCHIAMTTVKAEIKDDEVVLPLNGTLRTQIAIAHLDLTDVEQLSGSAIVGTEYTLQYIDGAFEFAVTEDASANINVTEGTTPSASYVVLFPNATANVDLKSNTSKKVTFEGGVEANKIYYKHVSDMEFYPLTWEDYEDGHEYVDLGLPSGLLWATCNVGANSPEEYGDYFAWGETETKSEYTQANSLTYGKSLNDISGNPQYDAATANWGGRWRMPTYDEMNELRKNCTWKWTTQNGVNGYKVTGPSGASIFLPAAGYRYGSSLNLAGSDGYYWSSMPYEGNDGLAYYLRINSDYHNRIHDVRDNGLSVRPVSGGNNAEPEEPTEPETPNANSHEYINLGLSVKWATCNVGATSPEDYGHYFAWGETSHKDEYIYDNCSTHGKEMSDIAGDAQYDAATANWGGDWRMPTKAEQEELLNKCSWIWTTLNDVKGYKVTGPNGASIFLPAAGYPYESSLSDAGSIGCYWSSSPDGSNSVKAYALDFNSSSQGMYDDSRFSGHSVRPVLE